MASNFNLGKKQFDVFDLRGVTNEICGLCCCRDWDRCSSASVGHHSIVAAGSVVLERMEIPPHSFAVGAPAQVTRQVNDRHLQMLENLPLGYHKNGQIFKEAGLADPDQDKFADPNV